MILDLKLRYVLKLPVKRRFIALLFLAFHLKVPVVLDGVIASPEYLLRDMTPPAILHSTHDKEDPLFFFSPGITTRH